METPRPYRQRTLRDGTILREFRADAHPDELVWHQDRAHRSVRVVESGGWKLQLEEGLPFPLVEGNTYEIPSRSWHRVIRGPGDLKIEIVEGNSMRITESQLRQIIREVLITEAQKRSPVSRFLRFGDPRKVEGGVSVIHDPYAYAYSEEPALFAFEPGESPPSLKSEKGISAYSVVSESPEKIIFKIGVGLGTFQGQLGGFLWKRMIKEDIWIFSGRQIPGAFGADDEPLVDSKTVKNVKQVGLRNLWVIDYYSKSEKKLSDVVDSRDLASWHDMGYDEFLGKGVSREEIAEYIASLKSKFTTKDQIEAIEEIEGFWNAQWEEDHPARETI